MKDREAEFGAKEDIKDNQKLQKQLPSFLKSTNHPQNELNIESKNPANENQVGGNPTDGNQVGGNHPVTSGPGPKSRRGQTPQSRGKVTAGSGAQRRSSQMK